MTKVKATFGESVLVGETVPMMRYTHSMGISIDGAATGRVIWIDPTEWTVEEVKPSNKEILDALPIGGYFEITYPPKSAASVQYVKIGSDAYVREMAIANLRGSTSVWSGENFSRENLTILVPTV